MIRTSLDGPEHAAERRLLIPEFTFRRCQALRHGIHNILDTLFDELLARPEPADLVVGLALSLSTFGHLPPARCAL
jgi:cytochrome P450